MNCRICGAPLSSGMAICPSCGTPLTINSGGADQASYEPTLPSQSVPPQPPTSYGVPPYGYPAPQDPYHSMPSTTPQNVYGAPTYGTPPVSLPNQQPYGYAPAMMPAPGVYNPAMPQSAKPKSRVGRIIGIVVAAVLLLSCLGIYGLYKIGSAASNTTSTTTTGVPSNNNAVASASAIISQVQTSNAVDSNYNPTTTTSTFTVQQRIYVTFQINSNGNDGYIEGRWFLNGQRVYTYTFHHSASNTQGYFSIPYTRAGNGAIALYWCTKSDCSDAQLAQVVQFTVTN